MSERLIRRPGCRSLLELLLFRQRAGQEMTEVDGLEEKIFYAMVFHQNSCKRQTNLKNMQSSLITLNLWK